MNESDANYYNAAGAKVRALASAAPFKTLI